MTKSRGKFFAIKFSRAHDEAILDWLARTNAGESAYSVAKSYGIGGGTVSRVLKQIREEIDKM